MRQTGEALTVGEVLRGIVRNPWGHVITKWHWKAALFSALIRAGIFLAVNWSAGWEAARGAALAEFLYRIVASGFYASITQSFRKVQPVWAANLAAVMILPAFQHAIELGIHWLRGTPNLAASIGASMAFTCVSTLFNLHVMRHGAMVVGEESQPLWRDLARLPRLLVTFFWPRPFVAMR